MKLANNNLKFYTAAAVLNEGNIQKGKENTKVEKKWKMEHLMVMNKSFLILSLSHTQGKILKLPVTESFLS